MLLMILNEEDARRMGNIIKGQTIFTNGLWKDNAHFMEFLL